MSKDVTPPSPLSASAARSALAQPNALREGGGPRTALLLVNLGTPDAPTASALRPYLREFLMDPRVVSIPGPLRFLLVNGAIAPFRAPKSAAAYRRIWTDEGSPLLVIGRALEQKVQARLDALVEHGAEPVRVALAMRYGNPSIESVMKELHADGIEQLIVFPLYPQHASATTGSSIEEVMRVASQMWTVPSIHVVPPFFDHDAYLDTQAKVTKSGLDAFEPEHTIFSFHGVPESQVKAGDLSGSHCLQKDNCCAVLGPHNRLCYRAHCVATARALAQRLGIPEDAYTVTFQSRLGPGWLEPFTDHVVEELAKSGVKRLAMLSPAFVADNLETLEELGMEAKEDFEKNGGEAFYLSPCINDDDDWVEGVVTLAAQSGWVFSRDNARSLPVVASP